MISDMLATLNQSQRRAVTTDAFCLVLAVPGSGKTRVIEAKAEYLLSKSQSNRVLAVSFTAKSAKELKERLNKRLKTKSKRFAYGTFHSVALEQLRRAGKHVRLVNPGQQRSLMSRAWMEAAPELSFEEAYSGIEFYKSALNPEIGPDPYGRAYLYYCDLLKRNGMMDFSDLLLESVRGMKDGSVAPMAATHLLCDEYQDADEIQWEWIACHVESGTNVMVVGDDDQSIYSWRRAMGYPGMEKFERRYKADRVILDTNYRSRSEILYYASLLISNNTDRYRKACISNKGNGGSVKVLSLDTRQLEIEAIVANVSRDPAQWAVLGRTNKVLKAIEFELIANGIPFTRESSKSVWDLRAPATMLSFLDCFVTKNSFGIDQLLSWIGVGEKELGAIHHACNNNMYDGLTDGQISSLVTDSSSTIIKSLENEFPIMRKTYDRGTTDLMYIDSLISSVEDWMLNNITKKDNGDSDLIYAAGSALRKSKGSLAQRISNTHRNSESTGSGVQLLTMHSSKGLEFNSVWIPAVEEDIIPHGKCTNPTPIAGLQVGGVSEERRLLYVGMTRAMENLVLSHTILERNAIPSRFLYEAELLNKNEPFNKRGGICT